MPSPELLRRFEGFASSSLVKDILSVTEQFYDHNPTLTIFNPPRQPELGMHWTDASQKPPTIEQAILAEMEAFVPTTEIAASRSETRTQQSVSFKIGLVDGAIPHTYLALPTEIVVSEYRKRFVEYFPHRIPETIALASNAYTGLPEGLEAKFLPLHSIVWCFMEIDGQSMPIDALSLITGEGVFSQLFTTAESQHIREDILTTMAEYAHVAAVSMFHLYERYFKEQFKQTVLDHRDEFGIDEHWTTAALEENFNLIRKGIRRHINIGYHPSTKDAGAWFGLSDEDRDSQDWGRGPQSQASAHIFLREVPFKKWIRLLLDSFELQVSTGRMAPEQYEQLDQLIRLALSNTRGWQPDPEAPFFAMRDRSQFVGEDPYRFIKALDPYAHWEGSEMLQLLESPLRSHLARFDVFDLQLIEEMAEAVQPYNRNISAVTMKFPKNTPPGKIMAAIGDIVKEVYWAKDEVFEGEDTTREYRLLDQTDVRVWQDKLRAYAPTRKMIDSETKRAYTVPDFASDENSTEQLETVFDQVGSWDSQDRLHLFKQWSAQLLLFQWHEIDAGNVDWHQLAQHTDAELFASTVVSHKLNTDRPRMHWIQQQLQYCFDHSAEQKAEIVQAFRRIVHHTHNGAHFEENKLAQYIVVKTLENEKLGIRPANQRTLNSTRLPGFLLTYDYINDEYLQFTLSPIISERGSIEQIKGIVLENR